MARREAAQRAGLLVMQTRATTLLKNPGFWVAAGAATLGTLALVQFARSRGIQIPFITG